MLILKKCKKFFVAVMCILLFGNIFMVIKTTTISYADTGEINCSDTNEDIETYGLMTKITLAIGSNIETDNGIVWAKAHNDFTLGFSTIIVYIELYSSDTYQEDYSLMKLESRNHISDLNLNQTLQTSSMIAGRQRYWMARMRYKFDNNDWVIKTTKTYLFDKDGYMIE